MTIGKDGLNEAQRTCLRLYGITKEDAHALGICVKCRETAAPKNRTIPDQREYHISGLCGECFDAAFLQHEDSGEPLEPKVLEAMDVRNAYAMKTDIRTLSEFVSDVKLPAEPVSPRIIHDFSGKVCEIKITEEDFRRLSDKGFLRNAKFEPDQAATPSQPPCFGSNPDRVTRISKNCSGCSFNDDCLPLMDGKDQSTEHVVDFLYENLKQGLCEPAQPSAESVFADVLKPVNDLFRASARPTADQILAEAAETFRSRNKIYKDNYVHIGEAMCAMFPCGIELRTKEDFNRFTLLLHCVNKTFRYATNLKTGGHEDSARDLAVYAAMLESVTCQK